MTDYRRLSPFYRKGEELLSWAEVKGCVKKKKAVWVEPIGSGGPNDSFPNSSWPVIPEIRNGILNLGKLGIVFPGRSSRFDIAASVGSKNGPFSIFQAVEKTKVLVRRVVSRSSSSLRFAEAGDTIILFIEEPVDPGGEKCLFFSSGGIWGGARVIETLSETIRADNEATDVAFERLGCVLNAPLLEIYRDRAILFKTCKSHEKRRKKKARDAWIRWEEKNK